MRMLARDGANLLAASKFQNAGGYYLEDMRSHTRYRSSYVATQFTQTVEIVMPDNNDSARSYQERCGILQTGFGPNSLNGGLDYWGDGNMTLTSTEYGRRDLLRYIVESSTTPGLSPGLLHMFSTTPHPMSGNPVDAACTLGEATFWIIVDHRRRLARVGRQSGSPTTTPGYGPPSTAPTPSERSIGEPT